MRRWNAFLLALSPMSLMAWGELRHIESKGVGYETGYTTLEAFYTPAQFKKWAPFLDLRGHVFDNGRWAANAGLGVRYLDSLTWGANLYYDFRDSKRHSYHQVGCGVEVLSDCWDFRANGYFPVGNTKSRGYSPRFEKFQGHQLILSDLKERALTGGNAEAGYHICRNNWFDLYAAAGPYGFASERKAAVGGEARVVAQVYDYLTFQVNGSYDSVYRGIVQGLIGFRIPFGETYCTNKQKIQKVDRHEIIVLDHRRDKAVAVDPGTGLPYHFVFVNNLSHSDGTYESPYPTLALASTNSSPNDVIYVFPGDGSSAGMNAGITLQYGQRLLGSGVNHRLPTQFGLVNIPALSATLPLLSNGANTVVTLDSNNTVSGFSFNNFNTAISGNGITNVRIDKNMLDGGTYGINLININGSSLIYSNVISGSNNGIVLTNADGNSLIQDNVLTNNSLYGIQLLASGPSFNAIIDRNQITQGGQYGINIKGGSTNTLFNARVTNNTLADQTIAGIFVDTGLESQLSVSMIGNLLSTTTGQYGFKINAKDFTQVFIDVRNNISTGATLWGIFASSVDTSSLSGNIVGNTFTGQGGSCNGLGMLADNFGSLALEVQNNSFLNQSLEGISVATRAAGQLAATLTRNQITGSGIGIDIEADTSHTAPGPVGLTSLIIANNSIESQGTGVNIHTDFNYGLELALSNNQILQGIAASIGNTDGENIVQAQIEGNMIGGIQWNDNSFGANTLILTGNTFSGSVAFTATAHSGNLFVNTLNNTFQSGYQVQQQALATGLVCVTLKGNESNAFTLISNSTTFPGNFRVDLGVNDGPITYLPNQSAFQFAPCN